jgi:hypothetical protein
VDVLGVSNHMKWKKIYEKKDRNISINTNPKRKYFARYKDKKRYIYIKKDGSADVYKRKKKRFFE